MSRQNRKLFELLVRENSGQLTTYLRTMVRDPGLVDDLFQETMITAWKKFDEFDQTRPLAPWLRGIALNLARNAGRRRQRDCLLFTDHIGEMVESTIRAIEISDGDDWKQKTDSLANCLNLLKPHARELVKLRYEKDLNASEIAAEKNLSAANVRKQLQRVRSVLANCVKQNIHGVFSS
ncbi:MAG: sigma-70 family RNA polymerase sigma factor [Mariniblastus sp.]